MKQFKDDGNIKSSGMPTLGERSIWKGYELGAMIVPLLLMLSHWAIFYVFSQNTHEVLEYPEANEICIAWIFVLLFLVLPLMCLPATYLYRRCNIFRIPFVYFIFINVERAYYGSYFCTNEMVDTHYILIYCIIMLYIFEIAELAFRHLRDIIDFFHRVWQKTYHYFTIVTNWLGENTTCEGELTYEEFEQIVEDMQEEDRRKRIKKENKR